MTSALRRSGKRASLEKKQQIFGYIFVIPFLIGLVFFVVRPLITAVWFSFCDLKITKDGFDLTYIGLNNYHDIFFVDANYRKDLLSSLGEMAVNVPVSVLVAFFLASLLNGKFRGCTIARVILFLPVITSAGVINELLQGYTLQTLQTAADTSVSSGLSDAIVRLMNEMSLNVTFVNFIASTVDRISDVVAMAAVPIVIFLAGLQSVSPSIYEASYIEGATKWEVFWKISLPMVSPLILVSIVYSVIDSFTNVNNAVISTIHKTNFASIKFGLGSSMALSYMLIMSIILALIYYIVSKFVFYQDR